MRIFEETCELWVEETRNFTGYMVVGNLFDAYKTIPKDGLFSIWIQPENVRLATVRNGVLYSDLPRCSTDEMRTILLKLYHDHPVCVLPAPAE